MNARRDLCACMIGVLAFVATGAEGASDLAAMKAKLDSLYFAKAELQSQLRILDEAITTVKADIVPLQAAYDSARAQIGHGTLDTLRLVLAEDAWQQSNAFALGKLMRKFPRGTPVLAYGIDGQYFKVLVGGQAGFVKMSSFADSDLAEPIVDVWKAKDEEETRRRLAAEKEADKRRRIEAEKIAAERVWREGAEARKAAAEAARRAEQAAAERRRALVGRYGEDVTQKILDHRVWVGMSSETGRESWGPPIKVNRTITKWGVDEQWVYGSAYLYFEQGLLTAIQDER